MMYAKGGLLPGKTDYAAEPGERIIPLMLIIWGITWADCSDDLMIRTKFKLNADDRADWSVICGKCSMGGTDGLLEVWNPADDEPSGGYTIDEVMEMVEKARGEE